ncbi:MAG: alpha/beta hydrolase-fold protein [Burkholderiaceae bacterium]
MRPRLFACVAVVVVIALAGCAAAPGADDEATLAASNDSRSTLDLSTKPPTRDPRSPGYPAATELPDGQLPSPRQDGNFILGPTHAEAPEMTPQTGVPKGRVVTFTMVSADSKIFPGQVRDQSVYDAPSEPGDPATLVLTAVHPGPWTRTVSVYIPAGYVAGAELPFMVDQDGPNEWLCTALDNLIAQKRVPAMAVVSIQNGGGDAQGSERGLEYDTLSDRYEQFVETEVLPRVRARAGVALTSDPDGRATSGLSSGAIAAFTMAWLHPEHYRRVLAYSITAVNQQWPKDAAQPGGAWIYHQSLIPTSPLKPIRVWMEVGDRDLYDPNPRVHDDWHDWTRASENMAKALGRKGYHVQFVFARNAQHSDGPVRRQTLPEALEYVWQGYPIR